MILVRFDVHILKMFTLGKFDFLEMLLSYLCLICIDIILIPCLISR